MAGETLGRVDRGIDLIDGFHAGGTGRGLGAVGVGESPHRVERDDLAGVAAHDGRRNVTERFENGGACLADAGCDRIEHPGFAVLM